MSVLSSPTLPPDAAIESIQVDAPREAAASGGASSTAQAGAPVPPEAIPMHGEWLAARGGGVVRLQLHPPELGQIELRVMVRGNAVHVLMVAQESAAISVAQEQRDDLAQNLAQRDLRMQEFEVRREGEGPAAEAQEHWQQAEAEARDSGGGGENAEQGATRRGSSLGLEAAKSRAERAGVGSQGVDLRI